MITNRGRIPHEAITVTDTLAETLRRLLKSDAPSSPALDVLIADYARYHLVLVIVGGFFLLCQILLIIFFWRRFRRAPKPTAHRWTFERVTYFGFGLLSVCVALFLALVVAANISNAVSPRAGFAGSIGLLSEPEVGTSTYDVQRAYDQWLKSDDAEVPPGVQTAVNERLAWQRPKALICSALLLLFVVLSAATWRTLIRRSRGPDAKWKLADSALLLAGVFTVAACLLLMLMVMGNTQAAVAPISMTMFYS